MNGSRWGCFTIKSPVKERNLNKFRLSNEESGLNQKL